MKKISIIIILINLFCSILLGCTTDSNEIDDQVYTLILGCDKGINNKIRLTIQFPVYGGNGGGASSSSQKTSKSSDNSRKDMVANTLVETIEAPSILEGINLLNSSTTRKISLVHTKAIVFSEALAKDGIRNYLEPIARFREVRRIMQVIVCRSSAEEFIRQNNTLIGESMAKAMELGSRQSNTSGYYPEVPFQEFYTSVVSTYRQPYAVYAGLNNFKNLEPLNENGTLPPGTSESFNSQLKTEYSVLPGDIPRIGNRKPEFMGTAIFNGSKMVGSLTSYETRYFLMVTGKFKRGFFTLNDKNSEGDAIPLDLRLGRKPKITTHFEDGIPIINIKLNIEADIGAVQSRIPYEKLNKIDDLNDQLKQLIEKGVLKTVEKTQKEFNTDIFGFGKKVAWEFSNVKEFEKYDWLKHYKDAKINVVVETNVRRTGLMFIPAPTRNNEDTVITGGE